MGGQPCGRKVSAGTFGAPVATVVDHALSGTLSYVIRGDEPIHQGHEIGLLGYTRNLVAC